MINEFNNNVPVQDNLYIRDKKFIPNVFALLKHYAPRKGGCTALVSFAADYDIATKQLIANLLSCLQRAAMVKGAFDDVSKVKEYVGLLIGYLKSPESM